jgi:hypothetical protein
MKPANTFAPQFAIIQVKERIVRTPFFLHQIDRVERSPFFIHQIDRVERSSFSGTPDLLPENLPSSSQRMVVTKSSARRPSSSIS